MFLAIAGVTNAADFEVGKQAYERGDCSAALKEFRPLAEQGHADAQYNLGNMYRFGQGIPQDHAEAAAWFRRVAERGDAHAQFFLGMMHYSGQGVPQDYVNAHVWFNLAGAQGHVEAKALLGILEDEMTPDQVAEARKLSP